MASRHYVHGLATVAVACSMALWPARARAGENDGEDGRAFVLSAHGGAYTPLTHLDQDKSVDFKTGFSVGGGAAYRINRYVALRGNFMFARAEARDAGIGTLTPIAGDKFNRYIYDGDLQLRYPLAGGATPYVFVGGGGLTVRRDLTGNNTSFNKGAGKAGVGLSYRIPRSNVGIYVEGTGWMYKWDRFGFDKVQFDTTVTAGVSYRFGL